MSKQSQNQHLMQQLQAQHQQQQQQQQQQQHQQQLRLQQQQQQHQQQREATSNALNLQLQQQHLRPLMTPFGLHQQHLQSMHREASHSFAGTPQVQGFNAVGFGQQRYGDSSVRSNEPYLADEVQLPSWPERSGDVISTQAAKGSARMRRRALPGAEHVKHRRTRSGCYTCRSRRVKCDEGHPVCERCKKGARECVYPEPVSATKSKPSSKLGQPSKTGENSGSSEDELDDEMVDSPTELLNDIDEAREGESASPVDGLQNASRGDRESPDQHRSVSASKEANKHKSISPSTSSSRPSNSRKQSSASTVTLQSDVDWSHLPKDVQFYLNYYQTELNHNFYLFKHDGSDFIRTALPAIAMTYDPLLYALVGFAAYHHTIRKADGKVPDFLVYYNKSVSLLRKSLQSHRKNTCATILTVLQLATIEEFLGDWVNLTTHQKAAYEMITELYTPETIMQDETSRKMFHWYARFDLFAGLMASSAPTLSAEWFEAPSIWYSDKSKADPSDIGLMIDGLLAAHRYMAVEMAQLLGSLSKGESTIEEFIEQNAKISAKILDSRARLDPLVNSPDHRIMSFEGAPKLEPDHIVDPYQPGVMFQEPLWAVNYMLADWYALDAMHKFQTALALQQPPSEELVKLALEQCRLIDAMDFWPGSPAGALLPIHASLGLICIFLPRDERHGMWCRRKLAKLEANGYIYPPTFRAKMAENWSTPSLHHWWLDDEGSYPPVVKAVRLFIEERTRQPRTQVDQDIRTMKALFRKMSYSDSPGSLSSTSTTVESNPGFAYMGSPQSGTSSS